MFEVSSVERNLVRDAIVAAFLGTARFQCGRPRVQGGLGALQQAFLEYLPALAPLCSFTE